MDDLIARRPDVLVLGAGGVLGEAWMTGVLAGIEDAADIAFVEVESFVGTSAGSIVAAALAAGERPRRPRPPKTSADDGFAPDAHRARSGDASTMAAVARSAGRLVAGLSAPLVPAALALGAPGGALVRSALLARITERTGDGLDQLGERMETLGATFDGRLRVVCVDRRRGRRVVFGAPGAPRARAPDAIVASCSIPGVFRPVAIGGREYVDGGVWSLTNLDVAPVSNATEVLCLSVTAAGGPTGRGPLDVLRAGARAAVALEAIALRRRGATVRTIGPSDSAARVLGTNLMDPRRRQRALNAGYAQGRELAG